jgi:uncharacterized damage-inducible protein DinB
MDIREPLIAELRTEAATTRRMLERVPEDRFPWRPHERSRTLGEIAAHIANLPGLFLACLDRDDFDRNEYGAPTGSVADILATFDGNVAAALLTLEGVPDEKWLRPWRYRYGERVIFELPRLVVARSTGLNHLIHHRGQLSVYLRLLDVPLPPVYGPTADEA